MYINKIEVVFVCLICVGIIIAPKFTGSHTLAQIHATSDPFKTFPTEQDNNNNNNNNKLTNIQQKVIDPSATPENTTTGTAQGLYRTGLVGPAAQNVFCSNSTGQQQAILNIRVLLANVNPVVTPTQVASAVFTLNVFNNQQTATILISQSTSPLSICLNPGTFSVTEVPPIPQGFIFSPTYQFSLTGGTTNVANTNVCSSNSISGNTITAGQTANCNITNNIVRSNPGTIQASVCIGGLPCGPWQTQISNGLNGYMNISSIDNQGRVKGYIFGQNMSGSWDLILKKITFNQTITTGANQSTSYVYTGFLHNICGLFSHNVNSISFPCFVISGSVVSKPPLEFGWIAVR